MDLIDTSLVLWVAGLTTAGVELAKKAKGFDLSRWGPAVALGVAELLTGLAVLVGVGVPEEANAFAWVGLHGFVAALVSMGVYDVGKRMFAGKQAVKLLLIGALAGLLAAGCLWTPPKAKAQPEDKEPVTITYTDGRPER